MRTIKRRGVLFVVELDGRDVEDRLVLAVHRKHTRALADIYIIAGVPPIHAAAEADLVVGVLPRVHVKRRQEEFAACAVRQLELGLRPENVPQGFSLEQIEPLDTLEREPDV